MFSEPLIASQRAKPRSIPGNTGRRLAALSGFGEPRRPGRGVSAGTNIFDIVAFRAGAAAAFFRRVFFRGMRTRRVALAGRFEAGDWGACYPWILSKAHFTPSGFTQMWILFPTVVCLFVLT